MTQQDAIYRNYLEKVSSTETWMSLVGMSLTTCCGQCNYTADWVYWKDLDINPEIKEAIRDKIQGVRLHFPSLRHALIAWGEDTDVQN